MTASNRRDYRPRLYLSGPMRDIPYFNFPAFHKAAAQLRGEGYFVLNPAEADVIPDPKGDESGYDRRKMLAEDMEWIALHADVIALLPGWERSSGSRAELALAEALDLEVRLLV